jgi:hypothetical protein
MIYKNKKKSIRRKKISFYINTFQCKKTNGPKDRRESGVLKKLKDSQPMMVN